ncbi:hypothetical protein MRB53_040840 [Persea americana]|nr:hypothetical protein MRB53_040840 [Persea americana]
MNETAKPEKAHIRMKGQRWTWTQDCRRSCRIEKCTRVPKRTYKNYLSSISRIEALPYMDVLGWDDLSVQIRMQCVNISSEYCCYNGFIAWFQEQPLKSFRDVPRPVQSDKAVIFSRDRTCSFECTDTRALYWVSTMGRGQRRRGAFVLLCQHSDILVYRAPSIRTDYGSPLFVDQCYCEEFGLPRTVIEEPISEGEAGLQDLLNSPEAYKVTEHCLDIIPSLESGQPKC